MRADDPIAKFKDWFDEAKSSGMKEPTAVTLATATRTGKPSARPVLLKHFDERGFVFFTNYNSRKGRELIDNPQAALMFYWMEMAKQIRIEGKVERTTEAESDKYFASRHPESQLGAWASKQSEMLPDRDVMLEQLDLRRKEFAGIDVVRPPYWGGFRLKPETIEFWQEGEFRLHQRTLYARKENGKWEASLLYP